MTSAQLQPDFSATCQLVTSAQLQPDFSATCQLVTSAQLQPDFSATCQLVTSAQLQPDFVQQAACQVSPSVLGSRSLIYIIICRLVVIVEIN